MLSAIIGCYMQCIADAVICVHADLRKRFEQEPINTAVELDSAAQLQCLPPAGQPTPEVWLWTSDFIVILVHGRNAWA